MNNKLSKSKYTQGIRCPKNLWLSCYKKEEAKESSESILENGKEVGDLARHLFGDDYVLINFDLDSKKMIDETNKYLDKKPNIICEASFSYDNNFCSVDILKNDEDGVEIYEVKSSTKIAGIYLDDISYQTWVLKKCGLNVKKSYLVYVNNQYVKNGPLDINEYFTIEDVTDRLDLDKVEEMVPILKDVMKRSDEPTNDISLDCVKSKNISFACPFFDYCTRNLPKPNVFDIGWGTRFDKKLNMYNMGKITFDEILAFGGINPKADTQMDFALYNREPRIDKDSIEHLLSTFRYPLYFLDFESYQAVIPTVDGTKPYQQICFQYSLHILDKEGGKLTHTEFLNDDYDGNPMYGLCKQLCEDIPKDSCVLVYNDAFEKTRLREMAEIFPEFSDHLLNIRDNIIDLLPPFKAQEYYVKEMGGSASIKKVLPALFPNDPSLDYHNLDQVHKGDEASAAYLSLSKLPKEEEQELRHNMLKYCELDTYAMVKIYEKLLEVVGK